MKNYQICIQSYLFNNSDYRQYDIYYYEGTSYDEVLEYAKKCIANWNKENNNSVIYNVYNVSICN